MMFKSLRYSSAVEFRTVACLNTTVLVRLMEFYYIVCPKTKQSLLYSRQFTKKSLWYLCLQFLDFWDCGLESRWGYGCSSIMLVMCCKCSGFCDELIIRPEASYRVLERESVCVCVCVSSCVWSINLKMRQFVHELVCSATGKELRTHLSL
jgi:hypothetical protein